MTLPVHIIDAILDYIPQMEGWSTPDRCMEMAAAVLEQRHPVAVSIGVFSGRSVLSMGFAMREIGAGMVCAGMVYGIDPYKREAAIEGEGDPEDKTWWGKDVDLDAMHTYAMHQIWSHNLDPWVTMIRAASQHVAQLFPEIGVLEIDGNHSEVASCRDVELYVHRLVSGGHLFFDDTDWATTKKAVGMIEEQCDLVRDNGNYRVYRKRC